MYYRVCKMMVRGKSNADYGRQKAKECIVLFSKMMVLWKSNADYGREKPKECVVLFVK